MNYHEMVNFAKKENADLVIAALPVAEAEAKRMGLLKIDPLSHVVDFFEKPSDRKTLDIFALSIEIPITQTNISDRWEFMYSKKRLFSLF